MFTAEQARSNIHYHEVELQEELSKKVFRECNEIGEIVDCLSKRGRCHYSYYKSYNNPHEVRAIKEELEKNGYKVLSTAETSFTLYW